MKITFKVFRFDHSKDDKPYYETFELEVNKDDVFLDILNKIKWEYDASLTYRRSCRHGICGICGIKVNNKAVLACKENVVKFLENGAKVLKIDPQDKNLSIKDLVIEKKDYWQKHEIAIPYLVSKYIEHPQHENKMTIAQVEALKDSDYCIQCGNCHYACPVVKSNENYLGPATFTKAFRFIMDPRGSLRDERLKIVQKDDGGVYDCIECNICEKVCPKYLSPVDMILDLQKM